MKTLIFIILTTLVLFACSKNPTNNDDNNNGDDERNKIVFKENTYELSSTELNSITEITKNKITFNNPSETIQNLKVGDVIVGGSSTGHPSGFLRKIVSKTSLGKSNGTTGIIEFITEATDLVSLIASGKIEFDRELFSTFHKKSYHDLYESSSPNYAKITAGIEYDLQGDLAGYIDFTNILEISFTMDLEGKLDLDFLAEADKYFNGPFPIINEQRLTPVTVWATPPVVITPIIDVYVKIEGDIEGKLNTGLTDKVNLTSTITYFHSWKIKSNFENTFEYKEVEISTNLVIRAKLGVKVSFVFYEIAGPSFATEPYLELDVDTQRDPWWIFSAGLDGLVGIKPGAIKIGLREENWIVPIAKKELARSSSTQNQAPTVLNPYPSDGETEISRYITIWWNQADPEKDGMGYELYVGKSENDLSLEDYSTTYIGAGKDKQSFSYSFPNILESNTTYYWRVDPKDDQGNVGQGQIFRFTTKSSDTGTVTDIDGNVYKTVKIGDQLWMEENLKVTHYQNGESIPNVIDNEEWKNLTTGAYCNYDNDESHVEIYGRLYNGYAVDDNRNVAPKGWHVPTYNDWGTLTEYLGGKSIAGGKMKETGTVHWSSPNSGATNESGFSALPGGCGGGSFFSEIGLYAYFWRSEKDSSSTEWSHGLNYLGSGIGFYCYGKGTGFSIRCVKD